MSWKDSLLPASFRGAPFKVAANSKMSGRRGVTYEFPKRDDTVDEDLGRRARRRIVSGYCIGLTYNTDADALEAALETEGGGILVLPVMSQDTFRCEQYTRSERKEEGGYAAFEMTFVYAGSTSTTTTTTNTQAAVQTQASTTATQVTASAGTASDWVGSDTTSISQGNSTDWVTGSDLGIGILPVTV